MWEVCKLGDVCEMIKRGIAPKYIEDGGIRVVNQKCIRDHSINFVPSRRHNLDVKNVPSERYLRVGDVLVNSTGVGTLGRVAQVREEPSEPTTVDTHVTIVRPKPGKFYNDFFGYMLIRIEEEISRAGDGTSGQTELARSKLENEFDVSFPTEKSEQQRVVAILDKAFEGIDAAIANTERNLANAQELFEGRLRSLFSEPRAGWFETTIGDQITLQRGFDITKKEQKPGNVPVVSSGGIKSYHDTFKANAPGVVIGRKGSLGTAHYIDTDYWPHDTTLWVKNFKGNLPRLVYYLFVQLRVDDLDSGTANPALNRNNVHPIRLFWPNQDLQVDVVKSLDEFESSVHQLKGLYQDKLVSLSELKQSILQKAFTGELTATDAAA